MSHLRAENRTMRDWIDKDRPKTTESVCLHCNFVFIQNIYWQQDRSGYWTGSAYPLCPNCKNAPVLAKDLEQS